MEEIEKRELQTSCMNCTNGTCRVEYKEKVGLDEYGRAQGSDCFGWKNPEIVEKHKILEKMYQKKGQKIYESNRV